MSIPVKTPTQIPDGYPKSKDSSEIVMMRAIRLFISIHSSNTEAYVVSREISIYSADLLREKFYFGQTTKLASPLS